MITFTFSAENVIQVCQELGEIGPSARKVLARATNETAKQARMLLGNKAREAYEVKKAGANKSMTIKKATAGNPVAVITAKGRPIPLKQFKASPASYNPSKRPKVVKARAIRSGNMKPLEKDGRKGFIAKMKSGHVGIFYRLNGSRFPIQQYYSVSMPNMLKSEKLVYGVLEPTIQGILDKQVERQIKRVLAGKG